MEDEAIAMTRSALGDAPGPIPSSLGQAADDGPIEGDGDGDDRDQPDHPSLIAPVVMLERI
jgi:hypothetical protein